MRRLLDNDKCCGCLACKDICTHNAISLKSEKGFVYPVIDENACVNCKRCENACPVINHAENEAFDDFDPEVWAAWNSSEEELKDSTSGGIFVALATQFIKEGGLVCGCEFSDDFKSCHHALISEEKEVERLKHSKYFQSDMSGVYASILKELKNGRRVMFCGTPCQAAALYNYVGEKNRENLAIVDLFCKGVPSQVVHRKYLEMLESKENSKIVYYRSKSKKKGWGKFFTEVRYENGKTEFLQSPLDILFVTKALSVRPACANCGYKGLDRVADITIGDYWGITGIDKKIVKRGISAIVINTEKGKQLVDSLGDAIQKERRSIFDVSNKKNPGFGHKIELGDRYDEFFADMEEKPFKKIVKKYTPNNSKLAIAWRKAKYIKSKLSGISLTKFIYINFLCSHVQRGKRAFIIPGPNTVFEFQEGSKLIVENGMALINFRKPKGSKAEAWIQLNKNATMIVHEGLDMRNCRFIVQKGGTLEIGELEMNGLCNMVVRKSVKIGSGVMIARNVNIYDSDYHPFSLFDDVQSIATKPVVIEDHVWIGNGSYIMKGVTIGEGSVVSAASVVIKKVRPHSMVSGNPATEVAKDIYWGK